MISPSSRHDWRLRGLVSPVTADDHEVTMLYKEHPDEALRILWEEYRYRHELCWRVPVQLTAAAVALSTLPYVNCRVVEVLGEQILLVPYVGVALTGYGVLSMGAELDRLLRVRAQYRVLQKDELGVKNVTGTWLERWFHFGVRVEVYLAVLLALQLSNISVLKKHWIPIMTHGGCTVSAPPTAEPTTK